jgi:hypothetical protein
MLILTEVSSRILSYFSLFFGLWTLIKSPAGIWGGVVWLPKLWASAWAPFLALMGGLGAVLGFISKDYYAGLAGLLAAALGFRHTMIVTRQQDGFAQAFGGNWEDRILSGLGARLGSKRYRLIQPASPIVSGQRPGLRQILTLSCRV